MTQADFFDRLTGQAPQNFRAGDPETSRDAGEAAKRFVSGHRLDIYNTLAASPVPLAAEQIADILGMEHVQINRRLPELCDAGMIEPTDDRHTNRSGAKARKYRVKS